MNRQRMIAGLVLLAVLVSLVPTIVATAEPHQATVQAHVWQVLELEGQARVMVILKDQANLESARTLSTKEEKGAYVYQQLVQTAENSQGPLRAYLDQMGVDYRAYWIRNMIMLDVDSSLIHLLARRPEVERIDYYYPAYPDPVTVETEPASPAAVEWNIDRVDADLVWGMGITGTGAVVADLDTGVDWDHPALVNAYRPQIPGAPGRHDYNWWDGLGGSPVPLDYDNHGTHTMGTMIGDDGGSNQIGMAPGARWIACAGLGESATPMDCFQFFLAPTQLDGSSPRPDLAPHVINNSWSSQSDYRDIIHTLYLAGIYYAKSAGNNGPSCSTVTNPSQWPEVTATASFANGDNISSFSSRGPVVVDRETVIKPDIAAPGSGVRSSLPGGSYGNMSGTSMACPHVAGAVALLISARPELAGQIDTLQHLLKDNAEPMYDTQCPPNLPSGRPNNVWGWGILNIYDAVVAAQAMGFGNLVGTVYDDASSTPIEGVQLDLQQDGTPWSWLPRYTDANGDYAYALPASTYHLTATLYGYLPGTATLDVTDGLTTTQDLSLTIAPIWVISGTILEEGTNAPLAASLTLEGTPVVANTNPASGYYSQAVAQGSYWTLVRSPGHFGQDVLLDYYDDQTQNFLLTPNHNYYLRTSDQGCGPTFGWIDATGGTAHPLSDDSYTYFSLGRNFTFYGNTYNALYIGSNGLLTFGSGWSKWGGPIPDPAAPNNAIYGFSIDLNPASGSQGNIYHEWFDDLLVIEYYQVEHYPSGDPETFEIILDFNSGAIYMQFLTVSDSTECVVGVENSTGTEATQYAYADPLDPHDNLAIAFYPMFSTPPGEQGQGTLSGTVTVSGTGVPIPGATVDAVAFGGLEAFSATTDISGNYVLPLCVDYYSVSASAAGYLTSDEVFVNIVSDTVTIQDLVLQEYVEPLTLIYYDLEDVVGAGEAIYAAGSFNAWDPLAMPLNPNADHSVFSATLMVDGDVSYEYKYVVYTDTVPSGPANWSWLQTNNRSVEVVAPTVMDDYRFIEPGYVVLQWPPATTTTENIATEPIYGQIWADDLTSRPGAPRALLAEVGYGNDADPDTWTDWFDTAWSSQQGNNDEFSGVMTPTVVGVYSYVVRFNANWGAGNPYDAWVYGDLDGVYPGDPFEIENAGVLTVITACETVAITDVSYAGAGCYQIFTPIYSGDPPFTFLWDFGDGMTSTLEAPTHTFPMSGEYTITLEMWNCEGAGYDIHTFTTTLSCEGHCAPVSLITYTYSADGCVLGFSAEVTGTPDFTFLWDFGDGVTSTLEAPTHTFPMSGEYTITLETWNCGGAGYDIRTFTITLSCEEPCAPVSLITYTYSADDCVFSFGAEVTGTPSFTWLWEFGDGNTSTETLPTHDYGASGTYTVTLDIWNCGDAGHAMASFSVNCAIQYKIYLPLVLKGGGN